MTFTLKTSERSRETAARAALVKEGWTQLRANYPEASAHRIMDTLTDVVKERTGHTITTQGVRDILIRSGLYTPRQRGGAS